MEPILPFLLANLKPFAPGFPGFPSAGLSFSRFFVALIVSASVCGRDVAEIGESGTCTKEGAATGPATTKESEESRAFDERIAFFWKVSSSESNRSSGTFF